jgi:hypothetical protein
VVWKNGVEKMRRWIRMMIRVGMVMIKKTKIEQSWLFLRLLGFTELG